MYIRLGFTLFENSTVFVFSAFGVLQLHLLGYQVADLLLATVNFDAWVSACHMPCPRHNGPLIPTVPVASRLWKPLPF